MKKVKPPRELAARALCSSRGLPENTKFEGRPMWESQLEEVDVVLKAALPPEEWERVRREGP
ncbi:hypothetical protein [Shinella sp. JR1-6]|uniref:hypothetical protein n=1 Tax=Shinella sp. JR1-6 TaxID=2527671 RepID=UPI00102D409D|nr:hypothetical protein [Shinella sp. JR1-6]TAA54607.1 hypothetical protein EXZ48_26645 [Shinella sp. JR1-6]